MFCPNCGTNAGESKFCPGCGFSLLQQVTATAPQNQTNVTAADDEIVLWEGQPSGIVGKAKSATKVNSTFYKITNQRIIVENGLISKKQNEIEMARVKDYKVEQSITEKLQGIGNITVVSTDITSPVLCLESVEKPMEVKELIRKAVMDYRAKMNISYRENV